MHKLNWAVLKDELASISEARHSLKILGTTWLDRRIKFAPTEVEIPTCG